jgi:hypothetical protein
VTRKKSNKSPSSQHQSSSPQTSKTGHSTLTDASSDKTAASEISTSPDSTSAATGKVQPDLSSSPNWPLFDGNDDTVLKGLPFFRAKKSNVVNFEQGSSSWKLAFRGSEILSWKDKDEHHGAVNLFVIGRLGKANFTTALSVYGIDPAYRLELVVERDSMLALRSILDNGPLKDMDSVNYPLLGRIATFSVKLKSLQKSDAPNLDEGDPFPYLFDGRNLAKSRRSLLKNYPADQLSDNDVLAVETNISSYDIPVRGESLRRTGYSLSLRCVYFLAKSETLLDDSTQSSPRNLKRQGDSLVSPRRNKKAGQLAVFSDED